MLRLIVFFLAVFALVAVLRQVPVVGAVFGVPLLGFWLTAILLSAVLSKLAAEMLDRRRMRAVERSLGATDAPATNGKLGALLLAQGRPKAALPRLEEAHRREPRWPEWSYRLGEARLLTGDAAGALELLDALVARDEEHAYGRALLLAARAAAKLGDQGGALARLERRDRNHGPSAESAFERGRIHRAAGRRAEARDAFLEVSRLAREARRHHRRTPWHLPVRAQLARWF